jgi:hypothetical protein
MTRNCFPHASRWICPRRGPQPAGDVWSQPIEMRRYQWRANILHFLYELTSRSAAYREGPHIGLASLAHYSDDGVATGSAVLLDTTGPVGTCVSVSIAHSGFRPPPALGRHTDQNVTVTN